MTENEIFMLLQNEDNKIRSELKSFASSYEISPKIIDEFINNYVEVGPIELNKNDEMMHLIIANEPNDTQNLRITLNLKNVLGMAILFPSIIPTPSFEIDMIKLALSFLYLFIPNTNSRLNYSEMTVVSVFHLENVYNYPSVSTDNLPSFINYGINKYHLKPLNNSEIMNACINLKQIHCLDVMNDCWYLKEHVVFTKKIKQSIL